MNIKSGVTNCAAGEKRPRRVWMEGCYGLGLMGGFEFLKKISTHIILSEIPPSV